MMRHLLDIADLSRADLDGLLDDADGFVDVLARPIPKVPALRGKTVTTAFFEASTRTRLSFERAAKTLSADTMTFAPGTSSLSKGESLKDTVLTLQAMGSDLLVLRHQAVGAAQRAAERLSSPVVNGGDGAHQHPPQAPIAALPIRRRFGRTPRPSAVVPGGAAISGSQSSITAPVDRSIRWSWSQPGAAWRRPCAPPALP